MLPYSLGSILYLKKKIRGNKATCSGSDLRWIIAWISHFSTLLQHIHPRKIKSIAYQLVCCSMGACCQCYSQLYSSNLAQCLKYRATLPFTNWIIRKSKHACDSNYILLEKTGGQSRCQAPELGLEPKFLTLIQFNTPQEKQHNFVDDLLIKHFSKMCLVHLCAHINP